MSEHKHDEDEHFLNGVVTPRDLGPQNYQTLVPGLSGAAMAIHAATGQQVPAVFVTELEMDQLEAGTPDDTVQLVFPNPADLINLVGACLSILLSPEQLSAMMPLIVRQANDNYEHGVETELMAATRRTMGDMSGEEFAETFSSLVSALMKDAEEEK